MNKEERLELAEILFPNITKTREYYEEMYPERNLADGAMVTRYGPSPTGSVHLGNLYSAYCDMIYARQTNGIFYLRIEDTDSKREVEGGVENIVSVLKGFNITPNEGYSFGGEYGPYRQSERVEIYQTYVKDLIIKGLAYPCFMTEEELKNLVAAMEGEPGDLLLFAADKNKIVWNVLGALRLELAKEMDLLDPDQYNFLWVTEFPLLEWSDEENRYMAMHHPFTMPMEEDWQYIDSDPGRVRAKAYDIVLNGVELGGGSVRIHQDDIQEKMFEVLGFTKEKAWEQFGFLLSAFKYGVPPHAGLAYGLDRFVMLLVHADSIREVIAFPKVKDASCLMTEAPGTVDEKQLEELGIAIVAENSEGDETKEEA